MYLHLLDRTFLFSICLAYNKISNPANVSLVKCFRKEVCYEKNQKNTQ